jgi:hypothetical protein
VRRHRQHSTRLADGSFKLHLPFGFLLLNRLRIRAFHRNFTLSSGRVEASEATIPSFAKSLATFNHSAVPVSRRILLSGESERLHDSTLRTFLLTTLLAVLRVSQITQRGALAGLSHGYPGSRSRLGRHCKKTSDQSARMAELLESQLLKSYKMDGREGVSTERSASSGLVN